MELAVVIALVSVSWSAGLFVGLFSARFTSKKDCEKNRVAIWEQVDAMRNCMTGGKIVFELKQIKHYQQ